MVGLLPCKICGVSVVHPQALLSGAVLAMREYPVQKIRLSTDNASVIITDMQLMSGIFRFRGV